MEKERSSGVVISSWGNLRYRAGSFHPWLIQVLPEPIVLLLYAVIIGIVGGYGAVGFRMLIDGFTRLFFEDGRRWLAWLGGPEVFFFPVIGLVFVSAIVKFFAPEAKGHGVPEVMAAIAERGGKIRPRVVLVKAVASALCIGSGGSVGREGPIVQIGSAFGSTFGQLLGLPERYLRLLVACGAGAGIAATFNAPVGGVMFATEVILGSFALQNFAAIVIASVVSAAIGRTYLGDHPSFPMPLYQVGHFSVYWVYVIIGLLAGFWGYAYIRVLYRIEDWFDDRSWPFWGKALVGGALIGAIGIRFPQIFGVGYEWVNLALTDQLPLHLLLILLILKLLATSITIAAGGSGGVFSPGLYQGAMLGGAAGVLFSALFPNSGISPGALAAMAMAGVFAGSARAPVTAIMMLFEMTGDYNLILPLMISSVLAATITGLLSRESIYTLKLVRRGLDITRLRHPDRLKAVCVGEALPQNHLTLPGDLTIAEAWEQFAGSREWFAWVRDASGKLIGSVARAQVLEALNQRRFLEPVVVLLPKTVHRIDEQETLAAAATKMKALGVTYLLVCRRDEPVGVIGSSDIVRAYRSLD
ncbi:chloride channel protein [Kyrpidia spormannii]|uniref:Chloride channel protein n=2 Tax=Kyrpidia spormannii TaxID=2055160 RepID=A0ACA8ZCD7_9BACL|nr:chloride channel protein [Kyrpidia spormannii]CAB3394438.1 Chloride channel protein [Kyrpidia spormannii]CAB3395377.1 Chloride channel protein [Kyrpidia spormannii]